VSRVGGGGCDGDGDGDERAVDVRTLPRASSQSLTKFSAVSEGQER
jgi:hypothetical protein